MDFETLITPRLILRKLTPEVYDYVFEHYSEDMLRAFLGITTEEQWLKETEMQAHGRAMYNKSMCWFQLIDKATQAIIGSCGYHNWYLSHRRAELGYSITEEAYKNKGLMTEALAAILDYGFNHLNLHRIEAYVAAYNTPSMKLMHRYNFKQEGLLRQHYFFEGTHEDSTVFGLLKEDYLLHR